MAEQNCVCLCYVNCFNIAYVDTDNIQEAYTCICDGLFISLDGVPIVCRSKIHVCSCHRYTVCKSDIHNCICTCSVIKHRSSVGQPKVCMSVYHMCRCTRKQCKWCKTDARKEVKKITADTLIKSLYDDVISVIIDYL